MTNNLMFKKIYKLNSRIERKGETKFLYKNKIIDIELFYEQLKQFKTFDEALKHYDILLRNTAYIENLNIKCLEEKGYKF